MSAEQQPIDEVAEENGSVGVFAELVESHAAWAAAVAEVNPASTGGRDRLIAAELALTALEELAARAGLLLADALTGNAPDALAELLSLLPVATGSTPLAPKLALAPALEPEPLEVEPPVMADVITLPLEHPPVPAPPVVPVKPLLPPVPVTNAAVALLKASLNGELKSAPLLGKEKIEHKALEALRKQVGGVPPHLKTRADILGLLKPIELAVADVRTWEQLSRRGRRILVESLAARVRAIQDADILVRDAQPGDYVHERTVNLIRELCKQTGDGKLDRMAWGLALKHDCRTASWLDDARERHRELEDELGIAPTASLPPPKFNADDAFRRLREEATALPIDVLKSRIQELLANNVQETDKRFVRLLEPRLPDLAQDRSLSRVTRAVASALAAEDKDEDAPRPIDANWYGFAHTTAKTAVIVGGDGRQERSSALKAAFRFAELDWPDIPKNSPGKANALVGQVRKGKYDIVICLQPFISHKLTDALFDVELAGTKVVLAQGYGVLQIRLALERYLPRPVGRSGNQ
jgi:hypothetical protein